MSANAVKLASLLLTLAALACPGVGAAAPCGRPEIDVTFPFDGAVGVPANAAFAAHYGSPATYDAEPISVTGPDGGAIETSVEFDAAESQLRVTPSAPLGAGLHQVVWPGLRGVGGTVGRGRATSFSVGASSDAAAPTFEGLTGLDWDLDRERDACTDKLYDRFSFRLRVGAGSDDAPPDLLALLVFETRAPGDDAVLGPTQIARRPFPGAGGVVEVRRPAQQAGRACFAAIVQDLLGNVSGGGEREVCVKTKQPPYFDGCSLVASHPPHRSHATCGALALAAVGLLRRGRNARAQRRHLA